MVPDIGGDVGALDVIKPSSVDGVAVESVPTGATDPAGGGALELMDTATAPEGITSMAATSRPTSPPWVVR